MELPPAQIDEPVHTVIDLRRDRTEPGARVAQRQLRPLGEVALIRGPVTGEVATGELGESTVAVDLRTFTEPVGDEREGMLAVDHRPSDDEPVERRPEQHMDHRLPAPRNPGPLEHRADLSPGLRPIVAKRSDERGDPASGGRGADALLRQPTVARAPELRSGQGVQQRLVLGGDQVKCPPVDPRDHERALDGERVVHRRRMPAGRASPQRKTRSPWVLALHGEQVARGLEWIRRRCPREPLRGQAGGQQRRLCGCSTSRRQCPRRSYRRPGTAAPSGAARSCR